MMAKTFHIGRCLTRRLGQNVRLLPPHLRFFDRSRSTSWAKTLVSGGNNFLFHAKERQNLVTWKTPNKSDPRAKNGSFWLSWKLSGLKSPPHKVNGVTQPQPCTNRQNDIFSVQLSFQEWQIASKCESRMTKSTEMWSWSDDLVGHMILEWQTDWKCDSGNDINPSQNVILEWQTSWTCDPRMTNHMRNDTPELQFLSKWRGWPLDGHN